MAKIAFIGNSEPPGKLLDIFRKMTPGNSGVWGELEGVSSYSEADYFGVIDELPGNLKHLESKCIFLGAHPPESHYAYRNMDHYKGTRMLDSAKTFGFGEWWIKYDYDYLSKLEPMEKTGDLCCILSDANSQIYHRKRRGYLQKFCFRHHELIDVYGRIKPWGSITKSYKGHCGSTSCSAENNNNHMIGKEPVYEKYRYAIEFDAPGDHYFSERVFDCLLLWCYPIYNGGRKLHEYISDSSFSYFGIDGNGMDILSTIGSDTYEKAIPHMKKARDILLNELQLWPRIHNSLYNTPR